LKDKKSLFKNDALRDLREEAIPSEGSGPRDKKIESGDEECRAQAVRGSDMGRPRLSKAVEAERRDSTGSIGAELKEKLD